jgi:hypothetical protein
MGFRHFCRLAAATTSPLRKALPARLIPARSGVVNRRVAGTVEQQFELAPVGEAEVRQYVFIGRRYGGLRAPEKSAALAGELSRQSAA